MPSGVFLWQQSYTKFITFLDRVHVRKLRGAVAQKLGWGEE
jgi:hypothetical protein